VAERRCNVEGCEKPHWGHGYCRSHWRRLRLYGHVTAHGTVNEYQNYGCRCDACKRAIATYNRERFRRECSECSAPIWRRGRKETTGLCLTCSSKSRRTAEHGTEARYKRCRCDLCRAAAAAARRRRNQANAEAARAYWRVYARKRKASRARELEAVSAARERD
jgi:hypothetical protein